MIKRTITLRRALLEDMQVIANLAATIFKETFSDMMPQEELHTYVAEAFSKNRITSELSNEKAIFIVAFLDQTLIGYAKLNVDKPPKGLDVEKALEMERLYILKAYHGYRAGSELMQYCIDYARNGQFAIVWLAVWEKNLKAIGFYQKWGFEQFGSQLFMRGNDPQLGLFFKKEL
jgi:ribosomal protein S18 acetylase RimI-like enzyme